MKRKILAVLVVLACLAQPVQAKYARNVAIVIWNGAEVLDWAGPSEVFESAANAARSDGEPAFHVYTVSKTTDPITSQRFITVTPQYSIEDAPRPDIIVLPGGGTGSVLNDPEFLAWASESARGAEVAMSVCTGAFVLGKAGLLDGRTVTTWHGATDRLEQKFPTATVNRGRRFVDNGQVLTTAGVSAGIDGALHLVARLLGRDVADQTATYMEYRWTPEAYLAQSYPILNPSLDARGRTLQQASIDMRSQDYDGAMAACQSLVTADAEDFDAWYQLGAARYGAGLYEDSAQAYMKAVDNPSMRGRAYYNAACSYARASQTEPALRALASALESGISPQYALQDDDLTSLRDTARFKALVDGAQ
jgi:transcriptional regulator GlxA family with amidase domain